ncbi:hypothetical protein GCM10011575_44890 [Microlunatus endophyticus]|uniref:Flavin-dependent oxidoreductase, luciferase family (Includes alkanesulfonate monooxygenase SsuD and methylene tetrahydromethanopterin reductase) n=1 Tax=Microlunatus endophyticus TaxID=1716077 RepID=A0A917SI07_9ACTN|nr:LLM class flavin-dependent oxidoreductase [Microlunatus endophyticus]GGL81638.1 hypothetical protein GCM10011575_44890 [Microlunatus endophyticus]
MPDYGRELSFGSFITPANADPQRAVHLAQLSEQLGLDLVTFQDHPYQAGFSDTWTLISYVAARTERIAISGNVTNLPLRPPAVLARSVASLDLLTGGRIELGIGAGGFWDAIEAMGGRRLQPGESVAALGEAITIIRELWDADQRGGVRFDGHYYQLHGAKRGPAPAHPVGIWIGAYKPRILRLTGRLGDGWLPSEPYLQPGDLTRGNTIIDDAARTAGREPSDIRRLLNVTDADPDHLVELALTEGIDTFIVMGDDPAVLQHFAGIAPEVRERVAAARAVHTDTSPTDGAEADLDHDQSVTPTDDGSEYDRLGIRPTADSGARLAQRTLWDESARPHRSASGPDVTYTDRGRMAGQHLIDVHDHLRQELETVRDVINQVRSGALDIGRARSVINELTMRQNDWTLGAYCAAYCRTVAEHHTLEDQAVFPNLRAADHELGAVLDRLTDEHHVIHEVLQDVDRRLVGVIEHPGDYTELQEAVDLLTDTLLSHLAYEERELVEPLARHGFYPGQL